MCGLLGETSIELLDKVDFTTLRALSHKRGSDDQQTYIMDGQLQLDL